MRNRKIWIILIDHSFDTGIIPDAIKIIEVIPGHKGRLNSGCKQLQINTSSVFSKNNWTR